MKKSNTDGKNWLDNPLHVLNVPVNEKDAKKKKTKQLKPLSLEMQKLTSTKLLDVRDPGPSKFETKNLTKRCLFRNFFSFDNHTILAFSPFVVVFIVVLALEPMRLGQESTLAMFTMLLILANFYFVFCKGCTLKYRMIMYFFAVFLTALYLVILGMVESKEENLNSNANFQQQLKSDSTGNCFEIEISSACPNAYQKQFISLPEFTKDLHEFGVTQLKDAAATLANLLPVMKEFLVDSNDCIDAITENLCTVFYPTCSGTCLNQTKPCISACHKTMEKCSKKTFGLLEQRLRISIPLVDIMVGPDVRKILHLYVLEGLIGCKNVNGHFLDLKECEREQEIFQKNDYGPCSTDYVPPKLNLTTPITTNLSAYKHASKFFCILLFALLGYFTGLRLVKEVTVKEHPSAPRTMLKIMVIIVQLLASFLATFAFCKSKENQTSKLIFFLAVLAMVNQSFQTVTESHVKDLKKTGFSLLDNLNKLRRRFELNGGDLFFVANIVSEVAEAITQAVSTMSTMDSTEYTLVLGFFCTFSFNALFASIALRQRSRVGLIVADTLTDLVYLGLNTIKNQNKFNRIQPLEALSLVFPLVLLVRILGHLNLFFGSKFSSKHDLFLPSPRNKVSKRSRKRMIETIISFSLSGFCFAIFLYVWVVALQQHQQCSFELGPDLWRRVSPKIVFLKSWNFETHCNLDYVVELNATNLGLRTLPPVFRNLKVLYFDGNEPNRTTAIEVAKMLPKSAKTVRFNSSYEISLQKKYSPDFALRDDLMSDLDALFFGCWVKYHGIKGKITLSTKKILRLDDASGSTHSIINLSGGQATNQAVILLCQILLKTPLIKRDLILNGIKIGESGVFELSSLIKETNIVRKLELRGCTEVGGKGAIQILDSILRKPGEGSVEVLDLKGTFDEGNEDIVEQMAKMLSEREYGKQLQYVTFRNGWGLTESVSTINQGIPEFVVIGGLINASMANIDLAMAAVKYCLPVEKINLSYNLFKPGAAKHIIKGLVGNTHSWYLKLEENKLGDEGSEVIADMLLMHENNITKLTIASNGITDKGAHAFSNLIRQSIHLNALRLSSNRISDAGAIALANGWQSNPSFQELVLKNNDMTDTVIPSFESAITTVSEPKTGLNFTCPTHTRLDLSQNKLTRRGKLKIKKLERSFCTEIGV